MSEDLWAKCMRIARYQQLCNNIALPTVRPQRSEIEGRSHLLTENYVADSRGWLYDRGKQ
jgi:hypothetical protein